MNSKQLQYIQVLAKEGSFGRAAEVLNISQPSLSQYVKKIEDGIGMELFDRSGGNVRITDAGRVYLNAGRKILDIEHQMQNELSDISEFKSGSVIVGTSPYRSAGMMPTVISEFRSLFPGVCVVVEEMTSRELLDAAEHGQFDICLTVPPIDTRIFEYEKIAEEELMIAVPKSLDRFKSEKDSVRRYPIIDVKDLNGMPFIMITETQVMQKALNNLCEDYQISLSKAAVVKSLEAQIAMVRAGVGMAMVPAGIERFCALGEVTFYSIRQELPVREVLAIWKKDRKLSKTAKALIDILKNTMW